MIILQKRNLLFSRIWGMSFRRRWSIWRIIKANSVTFIGGCKPGNRCVYQIADVQMKRDCAFFSLQVKRSGALGAFIAVSLSANYWLYFLLANWPKTIIMKVRRHCSLTSQYFFRRPGQMDAKLDLWRSDRVWGMRNRRRSQLTPRSNLASGRALMRPCWSPSLLSGSLLSARQGFRSRAGMPSKVLVGRKSSISRVLWKIV